MTRLASPARSMARVEHPVDARPGNAESLGDGCDTRSLGLSFRAPWQHLSRPACSCRRQRPWPWQCLRAGAHDGEFVSNSAKAPSMSRKHLPRPWRCRSAVRSPSMTRPAPSRFARCLAGRRCCARGEHASRCQRIVQRPSKSRRCLPSAAQLSVGRFPLRQKSGLSARGTAASFPEYHWMFSAQTASAQSRPRP